MTARRLCCWSRIAAATPNFAGLLPKGGDGRRKGRVLSVGMKYARMRRGYWRCGEGKCAGHTRESRYWRSLMDQENRRWIPAFAGMTEKKKKEVLDRLQRQAMQCATPE